MLFQALAAAGAFAAERSSPSLHSNVLFIYYYYALNDD